MKLQVMLNNAKDSLKKKKIKKILLTNFLQINVAIPEQPEVRKLLLYLRQHFNKQISLVLVILKEKCWHYTNHMLF